MADQPRILYCHCAYARVVPPEVKAAVLRRLADSDRDFEAVADLCEMSARRDPELKSLAEGGPVKIAACYPRAVKWLFAAAGAPLSPEATEVLNQREETAEAICDSLFNEELRPNLHSGPEATQSAEGETGNEVESA